MPNRWPMLLLFLMLSACSSTPQGPFEGRLAPPIRAVRLNGQPLALADLLGKPTVLVFWASWCGPCRAEAPEVVRVAESYGDRVHVLGVNAGEDTGVARRAAQQWGMSWPVALDNDGRIRHAYKVQGIPLVLIIDKDGMVRHRNNGMPSDIHRLLDGLLG